MIITFKSKINYILMPIISMIVLLLLSGFGLSGQTGNYNYFYRVYFKDKGDNNLSGYSFSDLLSQKAVQLRLKNGIENPDLKDVPVSFNYINQISEKGFVLHCTSRWMNTALFKTESYKDISNITSFPFVSEVRIVKSPVKSIVTSDKLTIEYTDHFSGIPFDKPLEMLNGYPLHLSGYNGDGITIAVLDGGFDKALLIPSLSKLKSRHGIIGTYDFILKKEYVYSFSDHGTAVLSVLAGELINQIQGTAPAADYLLLRTEDVYSEYPVEEDYWVAAAEFADSTGVDIITSSLGYSRFDDSSLDYKFHDMDGNTAFITNAADIAASKGILVVVSAGNERNNSWQRIVAPSDGDSVIAVGAVDKDRIISVFSSAGPSFDGRIKPDNVTMGVSVPIQTNENTVLQANGTSFSCPILSGLCACLMQAVPKASNLDIIDALHINADKYSYPDSLYGFGIPEMVFSIKWLEDRLIDRPDSETTINQNPVINDLEITFKDVPEKLTVEVFNTSGALMIYKIYPNYVGRSLKISDLQNMRQGIYIVRLKTNNGTYIHKIIKLNN
jgi:serine protease AprX